MRNERTLASSAGDKVTGTDSSDSVSEIATVSTAVSSSFVMSTNSGCFTLGAAALAGGREAAAGAALVVGED